MAYTCNEIRDMMEKPVTIQDSKTGRARLQNDWAIDFTQYFFYGPRGENMMREFITHWGQENRKQTSNELLVRAQALNQRVPHEPAGVPSVPMGGKWEPTKWDELRNKLMHVLQRCFNHCQCLITALQGHGTVYPVNPEMMGQFLQIFEGILNYEWWEDCVASVEYLIGAQDALDLHLCGEEGHDDQDDHGDQDEDDTDAQGDDDDTDAQGDDDETDAQGGDDTEHAVEAHDDMGAQGDDDDTDAQGDDDETDAQGDDDTEHAQGDDDETDAQGDDDTEHAVEAQDDMGAQGDDDDTDAQGDDDETDAQGDDDDTDAQGDGHVMDAQGHDGGGGDEAFEGGVADSNKRRRLQ